jgi:hypothetical protein
MASLAATTPGDNMKWGGLWREAIRYQANTKQRASISSMNPTQPTH